MTMRQQTNPAIGNYLAQMEKRNPVQKPVYWWNRMNEDEFIKTIQAFLWANDIPPNSVNWMKLLKGEYIPAPEEMEE